MKKKKHNLRNIRKNASFTQKDVAEALGVTVSAVSHIENHGDITLEDAVRLSDFLGCSLEELAGSSPANETKSQNKISNDIDPHVLQIADSVVSAIIEKRKVETSRLEYFKLIANVYSVAYKMRIESNEVDIASLTLEVMHEL